jgi:hypothetical protein
MARPITPRIFYVQQDLRHLYWGSHPQSLHSQKVARSGQLFVVLYDAFERGGLYIRATQARIAEGDELKEALAEHNRRRVFAGKGPLSLDYYQGQGSQRMYIAIAQQFWVNDAERGPDGLIARDIRREVDRRELTAGLV